VKAAGWQVGDKEYGEKQMNPSTNDQIEGKFHEMKSKIKETVGQAANNPDLEGEGKVEDLAGKIQTKVGQIESLEGVSQQQEKPALRAVQQHLERNLTKNKLPVFLLCASLAALMAPLSLMAQSVQAPVNLGTAGNFVILSKTGITDVPASPIVGNIGASPITGAAIHVSCAEVTGTISSVDAAGPAPCSLVVPGALTAAINDMTTAYTDAAGRPIPDFINLGAGNITGLTLIPGLYKWGTDVLVSAGGVTLSGGPNAVWIFQIAGDLTLANNAHVTLAGGAQASNIFWQVGASNFGATLGTTSVIYGNILSAKQVILNTGASLIGRALAQTQVTLQFTSVTNPVQGTFFAGEVALGNGVYYLQFPNTSVFGYYGYLGSGWMYHLDLGYEYVVPGNGPEVYLWDLASGHWWYTNTTTFPYLYDYTLNAWIYYFPDTHNAGHYTTNPRYFVNMTTRQIFTM